VGTDSVPRIKICGITSVRDAKLVLDAGADALGLVYASSVRHVEGDTASDIVERFGADLWCVGVFRHQPDAEVLRVVRRDHLRHVQLHDEASDPLLDELRARGVTVIRALAITSPGLRARESDDVAAVMIDGSTPGSGIANDWERVATLRFDVPLIVAGGLTPQTVAGVIEATSPWGVDVSSGVEASHGVKDPDKVASFVARARSALTQKGAQ
jgi:phosphoribosylanthranilate isomerase